MQVKDSLEPRGSKRIARRGIASFIAACEPARALGAGAVGEAVGHDLTLRLGLDGVVADRGRRAQAILDIGLLVP